MVEAVTTSKLKEVTMFGQPCRFVRLQKLDPKPSVPTATVDPRAFWKSKSLDIKYLQSNFSTANYSSYPFAGLAGALIRAYNEHQGVLISPDDFWITISHGFSEHVLQNAEKLRKLFVAHEGQKELVVTYETEPPVWADVLKKFQLCLASEVKAELGSSFVCEFSTTGDVERAVSMVGLMCAMQKYFTYRCIPMCGITTVYFTGTSQDWAEVRKKVESLAKYELDWWIPKVLAILDKLIETFEGKVPVDLDFWNDVAVITRESPGSGSVSYFSGWFKDLFPYDTSHHRMGEKVMAVDIPPVSFEVPFIMDRSNGDSWKMKFLGAYTGLEFKDGVYRPQLSLAVAKLPDTPPEAKKVQPQQR